MPKFLWDPKVNRVAFSKIEHNSHFRTSDTSPVFRRIEVDYGEGYEAEKYGLALNEKVGTAYRLLYTESVIPVNLEVTFKEGNND